MFAGGPNMPIGEKEGSVRATKPEATLLVVDDDELNRDMLSRRLEDHGFRVLTASTGVDALDVVASQPCDLVLLDVMMPDMSGLDVLASLRRTFTSRRLPVIMVTARVASRDVVEALELGANDYVTKPIDLPVALARVRTQLARIEAERTALAVQRRSDLQHAQKLSAVGQLTAGVAHDLKNLLTIVQGNGEFLQAALPNHDKRREEVDEILKAAKSAVALMHQLLAFSRKATVTPRVVRLERSVPSILKMLRHAIDGSIELIVTSSDSLWAIWADHGQLDQVIMNLVVNGRDAMPGGGRLSITLENVEMAATGDLDDQHRRPRQFVSMIVSDDGCGMDTETLSRIFDPFFTTKEADRGMGLGLAMVHGIIEQWGGSITVDSELGRGTTFRVLLPRADEKSSHDAAESSDVSGSPGLGTVLAAGEGHPVASIRQCRTPSR